VLAAAHAQLIGNKVDANDERVVDYKDAKVSRGRSIDIYTCSFTLQPFSSSHSHSVPLSLPLLRRMRTSTTSNISKHPPRARSTLTKHLPNLHKQCIKQSQFSSSIYQRLSAGRSNSHLSWLRVLSQNGFSPKERCRILRPAAGVTQLWQCSCSIGRRMCVLTQLQLSSSIVASPIACCRLP
jgi:hypothetical protein